MDQTKLYTRSTFFSNIGEGIVEVTAQPLQFFNQPDPAGCETDNATPSPNGRYLILQYNCEAALFIRLLNLLDNTVQTLPTSRGYLMDWSPDGNYFLFRNTDERQVWLIASDGAIAQELNLPSGAYEAVFAPDGQHVSYAVSDGLGAGSELGVLNLLDGTQTVQHQFPHQIIATPRWSPDGTHLAYILVPDSNIPYTIGELWLAGTNGQPLTLLDQVDAGHGYPPAWSPAGTHIAYIHRENPDSSAATYNPYALDSNIYQIEITTQAITPLTQFNQARVYDAVWSPTNDLLAFTADNTVWLLMPGQPPIQVSQGYTARHPFWLVKSTE